MSGTVPHRSGLKKTYRTDKFKLSFISAEKAVVSVQTKNESQWQKCDTPTT